MLLPEELDIIIQAYEEVVREKLKKVNIIFEGKEYAPETLLYEMKVQSELGLRFAEYLKNKGLQILGLMEQSDIFETLSSSVRVEPGLLAFFVAPRGLIYTGEDVANELLQRTAFGKQFAKTLLKAAFKVLV